jgi:hypothetical protein
LAIDLSPFHTRNPQSGILPERLQALSVNLLDRSPQIAQKGQSPKATPKELSIRMIAELAGKAIAKNL